MNTMGKTGVNAYNQVSIQTSISEASPHRLIQMLLDAALDKIAVAKGLMLNKKIAEKGKTISLTVAIIDTLRVSLDKSAGGEIANNLEMLYEYMNRRLTEANLHNDPAILDEVSNLIRPIKEAWDAIPKDIQQKHQDGLLSPENASQNAASQS